MLESNFVVEFWVNSRFKMISLWGQDGDTYLNLLGHGRSSVS